MIEPGPREDLADAITAHTHGWAVCKADGIERIPLGWNLPVGDHRRVVLVRGTPQDVLDLLDAAAAGTRLRLCGDREWWRAHLPLGWVVDHEGWYYSADLEGPAHHRVASEGAVAVRVDGDLIRVDIEIDGRPVAGGRAGRWGRFLTLDSIEVDEAFRRRGLGRVIVAALCRAGRDLGCDTGLLSSTPDGRRLYESMGFRLLGEQVCAARTADPAQPR